MPYGSNLTTGGADVSLLYFTIPFYQLRSQDSSVSIVNRLRNGRPRIWGSNYRQGKDIYVSSKAFRWVVGPIKPPNQRLTGVLSTGDHRPWCKSYKLLHPFAETKNKWSYTSTQIYFYLYRLLLIPPPPPPTANLIIIIIY